MIMPNWAAERGRPRNGPHPFGTVFGWDVWGVEDHEAAHEVDDE